MATDRKHDALNTLRGFLAAHQQDCRVKLAGLHQTLAAVQAAFDEIERRQGTLAEAYLLQLEVLQLHFDAHPMHPAHLEALGAMSNYAGVILRRIAKRVTGADDFEPIHAIPGDPTSPIVGRRRKLS